jgi:archaellum component FlaF (FlaF/FlaG flagellin family)
MLNKKGFSLSINMLVTIIIMVVLFSFGIYLFTSIFQHAEKIDEQVRSQEMEQLNYLLDDNSLVSVLNAQQTYKGDALRFPIGITNEDGAAGDRFQILLNPHTDCEFTYDDGSSGPASCCNTELIYNSNQFEIENNKREYKLFLVQPDECNGGFYAISFQVSRTSGGLTTNWGNKQMIFVTVP